MLVGVVLFSLNSGLSVVIHDSASAMTFSLPLRYLM